MRGVRSMQPPSTRCVSGWRPRLDHGSSSIPGEPFSLTARRRAARLFISVVARWTAVGRPPGHHRKINLRSAAGAEQSKQRVHLQRGLHLQEASEIGNLGLQSWIHSGREMVKWLHEHIQVVLLAQALPGSNRTTIHQQCRVQYPTSRVDAFCVLLGHSQVALLVAKQVDIKAWQQANDPVRYRWFVQPYRACLEHPRCRAAALHLHELVRDVSPCCPYSAYGQA